ncbi:hypothetical protein Tco_0450075 [Tanacetum coccineum]
MLEKMKSPLCVENKVRIAPPPPPPDYSKENLLATFAPQRNLTPEQIFWSIDEKTRKRLRPYFPKPLQPLTSVSTHTPVKPLSPGVLPTKSQVKINLYVTHTTFVRNLTKLAKKNHSQQVFTEWKEVLSKQKDVTSLKYSFFKTLKEHFAGVQTALFKEVKVMEEIFDQMNDEVDQNTVDKQCAEIERKNLLHLAK